MEKSNKGNQVRIVNYQGNHDRASTSSRPRFPPGYRFLPIDCELILEYLAKKVNNEPIPVEEISEVNIYDHPPEYLAVNYPYLGFEDWYFFTPRDRKYPKGNRPSRSVGEKGYWKATGSDKPIMSGEGALVGFKKTLVFYEFQGEANDRKKIKTEWNMHEYKLNAPSRTPNSTDMKLDECVLCRIRRKDGKSCTTQMDAEEDDNVAKLLVNNNNGIECLAGQAEPLNNIIYNTNNINSPTGQAEPLNNIIYNTNNINSPIDQNYVGPFVDNNNLYNAGAIRQSHVEYELNSGYPGQQSTYPAANYYPGQVPLPADMSSHFQNPCFRDETPFQYMDDFSSLSSNYFLQFHLIDHPIWSAPAPDAPPKETKPSDEIKVKEKNKL